MAQPAGVSRTINIAASDLVFSRDGRTIYTSRGNEIIAVSAATGQPIANFTLPEAVGAIDLSPDGRYVAAVGLDTNPYDEVRPSASYFVYRVDLVTGSVQAYDSHALDPAPAFVDVAFQPDGSALLSMQASPRFLTNLITLDFANGSFGVSARQISSNGTLVSSADAATTLIKAAANADLPLYVYTSTGGVVAEVHQYFDPYAGAAVPVSTSGPGRGYAISPDGKFAVDAGTLQVYDAALKPIASLGVSVPNLYANSAAFSPSGDKIYLLADSQLVAIDTGTWQPTGAYSLSTAAKSGSSLGYGNTLRVSPDGSTISIIGTNSIELLDVSRLVSYATSGDDVVSGVGLLLGLDGNDELTQLRSNESTSLVGGRGNDTYNLVGPFYRVTERPGEGIDTIVGADTYAYQLPDNVENLILAGSAIVGEGNALANVIVGTSADNALLGKGGIDTLRGLAGNDTLTASDFGGTYDGGAGTDELSYAEAGAGVTIDLSRQGSRQQVGPTGSPTDLVSGIENLTGSRYDDILIGDAGANRLVGGEGNNLLSGNAGADTLLGGSGRDTLDGGSGADYMEGGLGDDVYFVDDANDVVIDFSGVNSVDIVYTRTSYTLAAISSIETLMVQNAASIDAIDLTGNSFTQTIVGNAGSNQLTGGGGADTLIGLRGDDTYIVSTTDTVIRENAGEGNDTAVITIRNFQLAADAEIETLTAAAGSAPINIAGNGFSQVINGNDGANILSSGGGGGVDTMNGGLGDDIYRVFSTGDVINDTGGFDTVYASGTSYFLYSTAAVEYLSTSEQAGTQGFYMVGNGASQLIVGNWGDNTLNGRGGDGVALPDTLIGLYGNDTYGVFSQGDVVREIAGQGNDVVFASASYQLRSGTEIEVLSAVDQSAGDVGSAYTLRGNEFGQIVAGNNAGNVLDGRGGNDVLVGLGGNDTFAFTTALDGTNNVDTVRDFASGSDKVGLASDVFAAVTDGGIVAGEFVIGTAAADADDRLVYDQATGRLFFDADGNGSGAAVLFAQFGAGTVLAASDFVVVAPVASLPSA